MKIKVWKEGMSPEEAKDVAYWERNVLALRYADGWYFDNIMDDDNNHKSRFSGWGRVLSLAGGTITFHIPDDFEVGNLRHISPNWNGHSTREKWAQILHSRGVQVDV